MPEPCRFAACVPLLALALLSACGGGEKPADVFPSTAEPVVTPVAGPDSFLLFPNPQVESDGSLQTNTLAYAQAYYAAIDPANAKDTLDKWKAANRFGEGSGVEVSAVFGDFRDLGYGRRMTARQNADNTIAFMVENYLVNPSGGGYGQSVNLDAAVVQDRQWRDNVNGIEFSPGPVGTVKYAKFYSFDPITGARKLTQNLDGRGDKALPSVCISCHGGRADRLTPQFPQLENSQRGDVRGRLHGFELDALTFSSAPGFRRAEQEAVLKTMNRMVLCTYPAAAAPALPEDLCRQQDTTSNEWQAGAADLIKNAYGGPGLPSATFIDADLRAVPAGWAGQPALYRNVVVPACRACHIVRGTGRESDIDFASFAKFDSFAARTKYHVYERGNMPLAKIVFDRFWTSDMAEQLARYLDAKAMPARDAAGVLLRPGGPFADPGPDRRVRIGATPLSAGNSLFANTFRWTIVSGPDGAVPPTGASLANADTATPTFTAGAAAAQRRYVLELVASSGSARSAPARLTLFVNSAADRDPATIDLQRIKVVLGAGGANCVACHTPGGQPPTTFSGVDDTTLYNKLRGLANFSDVAASPLLRKPSGNHHNGGVVKGFFVGAPAGDPNPPFGVSADPPVLPGDARRELYDEVLSWILGDARR